jgi:hypothetical protein
MDKPGIVKIKESPEVYKGLRTILHCSLTELFAADENPVKVAAGFNLYVCRTPSTTTTSELSPLVLSH